jgi:hypothetical protein
MIIDNEGERPRLAEATFHNSLRLSESHLVTFRTNVSAKLL